MIGMILSWIGTLIVTFVSMGIELNYRISVLEFAERSTFEIYLMYALPIIIYVLMAVCSALIYRFGVYSKVKTISIVVPMVITSVAFALGVYHRFWPFPIFQNGFSYAYSQYYTYALLQVFPLTSFVALLLAKNKYSKSDCDMKTNCFDAETVSGGIRYVDAAELDLDGSVMAVCHREYDLKIIGTTFYVVMISPEDLEFAAEAKEKYGITFVAAKSDEDWEQSFFTVPWMSIIARDEGGYYAVKEQKDEENVYYIADDRSVKILGCNGMQFIQAVYEGRFPEITQQCVPYYGVEFYDNKEAAEKDYQFLE